MPTLSKKAVAELAAARKAIERHRSVPMAELVPKIAIRAIDGKKVNAWHVRKCSECEVETVHMAVLAGHGRTAETQMCIRKHR